MKKNILIGGLIVVVGILLYFLLREGKQYDTHTTDNDMVKTDNKIILAQRDAGLKKIDSFERDAKRRDTVENRLTNERTYYRKEGDKSEAKVLRYANEIKELRKSGSSTDNKCDSLAEAAINFAFLYDQYKSYSDSLTAVVDSNKVGYQLALAEQKKLYDNLYSKYEQLYILYDQLFKDYGSARKSLKREKLKTKVAALLALVAGGAAVIK
jgi:hypothetical protein